MNISKLNLPKGNDGKFILTKDAVHILKKAESITVSYNKEVKSQCFLMAKITKQLGGEDFEIMWMMPINVIETKYRFNSTVENHSKSALQTMISVDSSVVFMASQADGLDSIRFIINKNNKTSIGIFEQKIHKDSFITNIVNTY